MGRGLSLVLVRLEHLVLGYEALWAGFGGLGKGLCTAYMSVYTFKLILHVDASI